eukprot:TRINITY_DN1741_c0_g2_i1.p1 TRINITY_DN1741_c0_g2~~TRINITY_DN1741_c0_g2_i1.p1  ORF type:complete len:1104 (+),score=143.82 TRINITY_DN1741_c0_g2_i1:448-3312(+)
MGNIPRGPYVRRNLWSTMLGWNFWVDSWLRWIFTKWSYVVVTIPLILALALFLVFCGLGLGVLVQNYQEDSSWLWLSDNSAYTRDNDYWESKWNEHELRFIATAKRADTYGPNLINNTLVNISSSGPPTSYLNELARIHNTISKVNTSILTINGSSEWFNFERLCVKTNSEVCMQWSALDYWHFNETEVEDDPNPLATVSAPLHNTSFGQPLLREAVAGGITTSPHNSTNITQVEALRAIFYLQGNPPANIKTSEWNKGLNDWQDRLSKDLNDLSSPMLELEMFIKSTKQELLAEGNRDVVYLYVSLTLMCMFLIFFLYSYDCIMSKVLLALCGTLHAALACFAFSGVCGYLVIMSTPLSPTLYFMITAIAINHILLLVHAFERTLNRELQTETDKRQAEAELPENASARGLAFIKADEKKWVSDAMAEALPPITVECVSAMLAFLAISISGDPGFRAFGQQAAVAMLCEYVLLISFFCSCLVLDSRRIASYRSDIIPCLACVPDIDTDEDLTPEDTPSTERRVFITQGGGGRGRWSLLRPFITRIYAPYLLKWPVILICAIVAAALFGIAVWGLSTGTQSFNRENLYSSGSAEHEYLSTEKNYFVEGTTPFSLVMKNITYQQPETGGMILKLLDGLDNNQYVHKRSFYSWYTEFLNFLVSHNYTTPAYPFPAPEKFYPYLDTFLHTPRGSLFCEDLIFANLTSNKAMAPGCPANVAAGMLVGSRVRAWNAGLSDLSAQIDGIESLYNLTDTSGINSFPYGPNYPFFMTFPEMVQAWKMYLILSSVIVFAVMFLMLDVVSCVCVMLVYGLVYVMLIGIVMPFSNPSIPISQLSLAAIIVTTALTVNYSIHIVHEFAIRTGTRAQRMQETLSSVGYSIAAGFTCAILGSFLGLLVESTIYKTFVVMFISSIVFSFGYSFIFIPALLATIGVDNPKPSTTSTRSTTTQPTHTRTVF